MYYVVIATNDVSADGENCKTVIGYVNYAWLFPYAIFMIGRYSWVEVIILLYL